MQFSNYARLTVLSLLCFSLVGADVPVKPGIGSIRCEIWHNLDGGQITDSIANDELSGKPDETRPLDQFELNPAPEEPDACAVRGYIVAPATGDYTFMMSADDTAELYLSSDQSVEGRKNIASVPTALSVRNYKRYACQTSKPIHLEADKRYFIEALLKNEDGPSHISVAWTLPDGTTEAPIPGNRLLPAMTFIKPPETHITPPKLTLKEDPKPSQKPGFHKFVSGAHVEWPQESIDMSYLMYLPMDFDKSTDKKPMLVFLHGNSHQGSDLWGVLNEGPANYLMENPDLHDWFPMVGVFPQLPGDWRWDRPGAAQAVNALVRALLIKYPHIDKNRVYLTGLSMGGKGSWLTALDSPDLYAAMTTFSAVAVRPQQAKTKLLPIKNIHIICGADDGDFAAGSKQMFDALHTTFDNRVQFTAVEHEGHGVWGRYYPNRDVYEELMRYSK
jgi:pimeloyl-ACP methyl ester carboxylesterase